MFESKGQHRSWVGEGDSACVRAVSKFQGLIHSPGAGLTLTQGLGRFA